MKPANPAKSREQAARAIDLLKEAIRIGYSDYDHMQDDADLDPIRDLPAFAAIMNAGRADRRYAAVWSSDVRFESVPVYGLDPAAHDAQCQKLISEGFRPVSISVAITVPNAPPLTASVWHRPVVTDDVKDELAMRQARAADRARPARKTRNGLAAPASQRRPPRPQLHRQLAQFPLAPMLNHSPPSLTDWTLPPPATRHPPPETSSSTPKPQSAEP